MKQTKALLLGLGAVALLMGVLFMAQGSGVFPYPASSFMVDQSVWIYRGFVLAAAGAVMVIVSRRR